MPIGSAVRVADRTPQVAVVVDLDQRKTGVLLVIRAQAAVVRTAPLHRRVVGQGHLRRLDEDLATPPVVVDVVGHQHALASMFRASFQHQHVAVLEYDLAFHLAEAGRADRQRDVVEEIRAHLVTHGVNLPGRVEGRRRPRMAGARSRSPEETRT